MSASNHSADVEKDAAGQAYAHLTNETVHSFSWKDVTVTVNDRATKQPLEILSGINGVVQAGEMLALMGPRYTPNKIPYLVLFQVDIYCSGSGKTTLLNVLAHRAATSKSSVQQELYINGSSTDLASFRKLSCYVEQEDALVGSLTVRETLHFAAQLALPR
jgi:ABC-type multidrug transport system ATPase subunit